MGGKRHLRTENLFFKDSVQVDCLRIQEYHKFGFVCQSCLCHINRMTSFFDVFMEEGKEKLQTFLKKPSGTDTIYFSIDCKPSQEFPNSIKDMGNNLKLSNFKTKFWIGL